MGKKDTESHIANKRKKQRDSLPERERNKVSDCYRKKKQRVRLFEKETECQTERERKTQKVTLLAKERNRETACLRKKETTSQTAIERKKQKVCLLEKERSKPRERKKQGVRHRLLVKERHREEEER